MPHQERAFLCPLLIAHAHLLRVRRARPMSIAKRQLTISAGDRCAPCHRSKTRACDRETMASTASRRGGPGRVGARKNDNPERSPFAQKATDVPWNSVAPRRFEARPLGLSFSAPAADAEPAESVVSAGFSSEDRA